MNTEPTATTQFTALNERFARMGEAVKGALQVEMESVCIDLVGYIRSSKLSGQVLGVRSGMLRNSVGYVVDKRFTAVVARVGVLRGPATQYAAAHEYGGTVSIPPRTGGSLMRFMGSDGGLVFTRRRRAYTVVMPERSYVRSAVEDQSEQINSRLQNAALDAALGALD